MAHNRTAIRAALATAFGSLSFSAWTETPGTRIDVTLRPRAVFTLPETAYESGEWVMGADSYDVEHSEGLTVELHADGATGENVADAIDAMELEIEAALAVDLTLGGLCENIVPIGSELEMNQEQDRVIGVRSCNYAILWRATFGTPDQPEA